MGTSSVISPAVVVFAHARQDSPGNEAALSTRQERGAAQAAKAAARARGVDQGVEIVPRCDWWRRREGRASP